jgi:hypothetical protein
MTQPAPQTAPAVSTGNSMTMILGVIGAILMVVGAFFFDWISGVASKGTDAGIAIFWSTNPAAEPSFFASAGFVVLVIAVITAIGAAMGRSGWVIYGGVLAVLAFVLPIISFYRLKGADLGIGDAGLGLWAILVGGVVAIAAGAMGRRTA